jgi:hypothetical protein
MGKMYVSGTQGIPKTDLLELVVSKHGTLFGNLNDGKIKVTGFQIQGLLVLSREWMGCWGLLG